MTHEILYSPHRNAVYCIEFYGITYSSGNLYTTSGVERIIVYHERLDELRRINRTVSLVNLIDDINLISDLPAITIGL